MFVRVLTGMKAANQSGEPETVLEYTKEWSELIDRGGLYHINEQIHTDAPSLPSSKSKCFSVQKNGTRG